MHWIDWSILAAFSVFLIAIAYSTKKYSRSVADFLAASRCGGRYILAMSDGMAALGAVSMVAMFQMYYKGGFTVFWWQSVTMPVMLLVSILGWVIYRFRQTRAFTFGQFFEIRYSRRFRLFAGMLAWVAGIINFGVFPSVGARFFIYFCDLPQTLPIFGMDLSTYGLVMAFLILLAVGFTFIGGQIAVMVTDFIQAAFCNMIFILILVLLYVHFNWNDIAASLAKAPPGKSMVNPFDIGSQENYDTFYYMIAIFLAFYGAYSWQGQQGYNSSARNAHEAKMSKVVGFYRWPTQIFFVMVLCICAYTLMHHGNFAGQAVDANSALSTIDSEQIRDQMTVPLAIKQVLPVGVMGAFCAVMFAAFISTHDTYLHAWGSIFVQDVILPLRKNKAPLTPKQHLRYLRWSIFGVAVFIFCFSFFYVQKMDIMMFFALSGAIFVGGAGAAIIGGLYWKRGTTAGAWVAMITGSAIGILGFVLTHYWTDIADYIQWDWPNIWSTAEDYIPGLNGKTFFLTGQEIGFFAGVVSIVGYVLVSLLGRREVFNLDKMLHRGKYATDKDPQAPDEPVAKIGWKNVLGFDKHFTLSDKIIYVVSYITMVVLIIGSIVGAVWRFDITDASWLSFWHGFVGVFGVVTVALILWLTIGGFFDLKKLFVLLRKVKRDDADDGTVIDHHNLDEEQ